MLYVVAAATGFTGKRLVKPLRQMVEFAKAVAAGHVHHVSSIAAAGLHEGTFRKVMLDAAEGLDHPYFMTQHESEKIVRKACRQPWRRWRDSKLPPAASAINQDRFSRR